MNLSLDTTGQEAAEKTEAAATEQTEEEKKEETGAEGAEGEKKEEEEGEKKEGEGEGAVTVEAQVEGNSVVVLYCLVGFRWAKKIFHFNEILKQISTTQNFAKNEKFAILCVTYYNRDGCSIV